MLCEETKRDIRRVLDALGDGDAGAWEAVTALSDLGRSGTEISIDFTTVPLLGAPVIVARMVPPALSGLTPRQSEVAACLGQGLSNKLIARRLGISLATVKDHVHAILSVTGAKSRAEVIVALHGRKPSLSGAPDPSIQGWNRPPVASNGRAANRKG